MTTTPTQPKVTVVDEVPRMDFADERITGVLLSATAHTSATCGFIAPGVAQTRHVQRRPDNGDEIIFVYHGRFRVVGDGWPDTEYDTVAEGPVYIEVPSGVAASLVNLGDTEVRFFSVFAPPFAPGEIEFLE